LTTVKATKSELIFNGAGKYDLASTTITRDLLTLTKAAAANTAVLTHK